MALKLRKEERQFVKTLAKKYKLVPHLERAIAQGEFAWEFKHEPKQSDDAWHPSGDCTPSLHELYLNATAPVEDDRSGLYKTFMVGHFWHQYLQHILLHRLEFCSWKAIERRGVKGWEPADNPRLDPYFEGDFMHWRPFHWVTGAADVAPCDVPGEGLMLVDFKTMKSMDFRKENMPEWSADKYECQMNIYFDLFNLERGLIVAINKDSPHDMKEFEFERNPDLIDALYRKWELVSLCIDERIAPPQDEEIYLPLKGPKHG